jgi:hypothetical protein
MRSSEVLLLSAAVVLGCGSDAVPVVEIAADAAPTEFDVAPFEDAPPPVDATCATAEIRAARPPIDVIVTVDQSASMNDDIARVKANINRLSEHLAATGLDHRVVMIARVGKNGTDVCVPPPLGGDGCASNEPIFRAVDQPVGSFDALVRILLTLESDDPKLRWKDVLRPESIKAFVPITDDDATSGPKPDPIAETFDRVLLQRGAGLFGKATARRYVFFPICGADPNDPSKTCGPSIVKPGSIYVELARKTGGRTFPICANDYGPLFTEIARSIERRVACEIVVPDPPVGSIFDPAKVTLDYRPSAGGEVPIVRDERDCETGANGWQYGEGRATIRLCGTACRDFERDRGGKIDVTFGCVVPGAPTCGGLGSACASEDECCPGLECPPPRAGEARSCRLRPPR